MWIAGIAVILFSVAGIAAIMGWIPTSLVRANVETVASAARPDDFRAAAAAHQRAAPRPLAERAAVRQRCADCGVVESTRAVTSKSTGAGGGNGPQAETVATASGATGGAVAGNEDKRVKSTTGYEEVTVRLDDGSSRILNEESPTAWHAGDRVKIVSGELQAYP